MTAPAYYNEIDPYAASWLRQLIAAGHLMAGEVDERSILDVSADDLRGYGQCHFFAGIGGWPYALQLAGWDRGNVWTGSGVPAVTRLADQIIAARGSYADQIWRGALSEIGAQIARAEAFELSADVLNAIKGVLEWRPSSVEAAFDFARLPYPRMWVEWVPSDFGRVRDEPTPLRPAPRRIGFLAEQLDGYPGCGALTWAWAHDATALGRKADDLIGLNMCPLAFNFDFRPVPNTVSLAKDYVRKFGKYAAHTPADRDLCVDIATDIPGVREVMKDVGVWSKYHNNDDEVESVYRASNYGMLALSHYCREMLNSLSSDAQNQLLDHATKDITGEPAFAQALLILMNARNGIQQERQDLSKINKARAKAGKAPLKEFSITRLMLRPHHARGIGGGDRAAMRQHAVRGHFKVRKSGVYWWSTFLRGDPAHAVPRDHYEVRA